MITNNVEMTYDLIFTTCKTNSFIRITFNRIEFKSFVACFCIFYFICKNMQKVKHRLHSTPLKC